MVLLLQAPIGDAAGHGASSISLLPRLFFGGDHASPSPKRRVTGGARTNDPRVQERRNELGEISRGEGVIYCQFLEQR